MTTHMEYKLSRLSPYPFQTIEEEERKSLCRNIRYKFCVRILYQNQMLDWAAYFLLGFLFSQNWAKPDNALQNETDKKLTFHLHPFDKNWVSVQMPAVITSCQPDSAFIRPRPFLLQEHQTKNLPLKTASDCCFWT